MFGGRAPGALLDGTPEGALPVGKEKDALPVEVPPGIPKGALPPAPPCMAIEVSIINLTISGFNIISCISCGICAYIGFICMAVRRSSGLAVSMSSIWERTAGLDIIWSAAVAMAGLERRAAGSMEDIEESIDGSIMDGSIDPIWPKEERSNGIADGVDWAD